MVGRKGKRVLFVRSHKAEIVNDPYLQIVCIILSGSLDTDVAELHKSIKQILVSTGDGKITLKLVEIFFHI